MCGHRSDIVPVVKLKGAGATATAYGCRVTVTEDPAILCLGLNPALDITYQLDRLDHGESQKVTDVRERAGGKATNVARVAAQVGGASHLLAALGGPVGAAIADELYAGGVRFTRVASPRHTRRTVTIVESDGTTTALNEAGMSLPAEELADVLATLRELLATSAHGSVLVLSGSLPPGTPDHAYADCVAAARDHGIPAIVDCSGPALLAALDAGAALVKPNRHELLATVGADGVIGAQRLRKRAPDAVVVASDGPAGLLCVGPDGTWRATPARALVGNPTGAGDALVAALAVGMARGDDLPTMLRAAVGSSGSAVLNPVAGHIDPAVAADLAAQATLSRID